MITADRFRVGHVLAVAFLLAFVVAAMLALSDDSEAQSRDAALTPALQGVLSNLSGDEEAVVILTFRDAPTNAQVSAVENVVGDVQTFDELPMLAVSGTAAQINGVLGLNALGGLVSAYPNKELDYYLDESRSLIGADRVEQELGFTGNGVGVAVIDSGIDATHGDLAFGERTVQNVKFTGVPGTPLVTGIEGVANTDTTSGHGTHVAGTIGGDGSLSGGKYTGIAPESELIGLGTGEAISILYAVEAFDYALENQQRYDIRVISNSYGTTGAYDASDPLNVASKAAHDAGMTVVFAGGNEGPGNNTMNPYALPDWVIGVAAGEKDGKTLAEFSSRGVPGSRFNAPDITAPGVDIAAARSKTCTICTGTDLPAGETLNYTTLSGTSMATPHVSGVVALMEEANGNLTPDQIKAAIENAATPMDYAYHEAGAGYVDAYAAVQSAQ